MSHLINYLGPKSYPSIVNQIAEKLSMAKSESFQANEMIQKALVTMNESNTPMMDLREFTTNAEPLAKTDATLAEILTFITKNVQSGDLNFLVNMAKEEHFKEMSRAGFPSVEDTIKAYQEYFSEPSSVIEQAIKNGIFDKLKSNLMMDLKSTIVDDGKTKIVNPTEAIITLNENNVFYNQNLVAYNPVALRMEDIKNNRLLFLTESDVLSYNRENKEFSVVTNVELMNLEILESHKRMMLSIQELSYNPEQNTFSPALEWDFNLLINSAGDIIMSDKENNNEIPVAKEDLPVLLMESIATYEKNTPGFIKNSYLRDADNIILMVENHSKLVKLDALSVIRNLNESSNYVIVEPASQKTPKLIAGSNVKETELFESYLHLNNACSEKLGISLTGLFESQLEFEKEFNHDRNNQIVALREEQSNLNSLITENNSLLGIAEEGSPAYEKLVESKEDLTSKLELNIQNLNHYTNTHKLYN